MINKEVLARLTEITRGKNVKLIAISKTKSEKEILEVYNTGQKIFGENKVQELVQKYEALPKDIEWHLVGTLQTNKVKYIAPFVSLIHSVDSLKLAIEINKQAQKCNRVIDVLLEVFIAAETTKHGFSEDELMAHLDINAFASLENIRIVGLMGMATYTQNKIVIRNEFAHLKNLFDRVKSTYFQNHPEFKELSMGMSGDYEIAIEKGSTMIRIGSAIFGERERKKSANVPL
jgi:pyridoxal phosphate enzyme (YggS family)